MHLLPTISTTNVQEVYHGAEGRLWELVMGEQIHIGGLNSSMDLAERAGIAAGSQGVDLCCCNGAGCRFLLRFRGVAQMTGVDMTPEILEQGRSRNLRDACASQITFVQAYADRSGLPTGKADFVWGEDAWCYVPDKSALIKEAARLVRPGGTIAFTDWCEGKIPMTAAEAARFMAFMKFPSFASIPDYMRLLSDNGCKVEIAEDTGRFPACVDLYLNMLTQQLTSDALRIIGWNQEVFAGLGGEMAFVQNLAHAGKLVQARFVARKP
jgi:SAM-dependent methyltransferase